MSDEPDLLSQAREALRESHPLPLLAMASSLMAVFDPRLVHPLDQRPDGDDGPTREEFVESFLAVRRPEISGLLAAIAELTDDEFEQRRIRRELAERGTKPPRWLRRLEPLEVAEVVEMAHVLGDGDNLMIGVTTANDDAMTVVVYIDHNVGTLVKDAFVIDAPLAEIVQQFRDLTEDDPDTTFTPVDTADARARITEAIEQGAMTYPQFETESWPACRPFVEWVVRHLPDGGTGYVREEWPEDQRDALVERFIASGHAPDKHQQDAHDLADVIVWFACDYGPGDPLRWSSVAVEIFLTGFLHRKALYPKSTLRRAPKVLAAFVRFAHAERGISDALTSQTLDAVEEYTAEYYALLDDDGTDDFRTMITDLVAEHGLGETGVGFTFDASGQPVPIATVMRSMLIEQVGDEATLDNLGTEPLPDEALDLSEVAEDVGERVGRVAALTDACCDELLDVEHRTACRRLLVDVAAADPAIFRRRSRDDTAAAAIAWAVTKANGTLQPYHGGLTAKALLGWFGITGSVSQRAETMLRAIGTWSPLRTDVRLGNPRYLVADARTLIIDQRERYR